VFGAPGSLVQGNTIISNTQTLLGGIIFFYFYIKKRDKKLKAKTITKIFNLGINMVDFDPYNGNYTGTVVQNNNINANTSFIKVLFLFFAFF
jgi:hypothetical protein